jgi:hypothetical protein
MKLKDMDIVYPYIPWPFDGKELRYSLRTVAKNVPHRNIVLIGRAPERLNTKEVKYIPFWDEEATKYLNVKAKMFHIYHDNSISKQFIWMNDDMLVLKPITEIPNYVRWHWEEHLNAIERRAWHSRYRKILEQTRLKFPEWFSYEVHTPIIFDKEKLISLFDMYWDELESMAMRSVYWNTFCNPSFFEEEFWMTDCKSYTGRREEMWDINKLTYISTYDEIKYAYTKRLDANFEKCIYEL